MKFAEVSLSGTLGSETSPKVLLPGTADSMNLNSNLNLKDLKFNWRKHVYVLTGIAITGLLAFMIFRSFAFLAGQVAVVFQFDISSQQPRSGFDTENFERIKDRLE